MPRKLSATADFYGGLALFTAWILIYWFVIPFLIAGPDPYARPWGWAISLFGSLLLAAFVAPSMVRTFRKMWDEKKAKKHAS